MVNSVSSLGMGAWDQVDAADLSATRRQREAQAFSAMYTNGDGAVSSSEFATWLQQAESQAPQTGAAATMPSATDLFSQLDTNGDGVLTPDEASSMPQKLQAIREAQLFQAMDTNGDGVISPDEFTNWMTQGASATAATTGSQAPATSTGSILSQLTQDVGTTVNGLLSVMQQGASAVQSQTGAQAASSTGTLSIEALLASYMSIGAALKQYGETEPGSILNVDA